MAILNLKVKVIGSGGIGLCLIDPLCRLLNYGSGKYSFGDVDVAIIDGDQFEERNKDRQAFRERGNKAEVTIKRLEEDYPNLVLRAHPAYIDEGNVGMFIQEGDTVLLCVDNHKTRRLVSRYCEQELQNVVLISGGNNLLDGNMQIFIRKDGWNITDPLDSVVHPEISNPTDKHPNEIEHREGCLEESVSAPQLLVANNMAAALMLTAFHNYLTDCFSADSPFKYDEVQFDLKSNTSRAISRSKHASVEDVAREKIERIRQKKSKNPQGGKR